MSRSEGLMGARGQIVWILALVVSTGAIIYLERLDMSVPHADAKGAVLQLRDGALAADATLALAAAEARMTEAPDDPEAAAQLLLALSVAVQAGALDVEAGRTRADAVHGKAAAAGPAWQSVAVLAALTFRR
jgi:hypothetical protein